jgi:hypothetical protein
MGLRATWDRTRADRSGGSGEALARQCLDRCSGSNGADLRRVIAEFQAKSSGGRSRRSRHPALGYLCRPCQGLRSTARGVALFLSPVQTGGARSPFARLSPLPGAFFHSALSLATGSRPMAMGVPPLAGLSNRTRPSSGGSTPATADIFPKAALTLALRRSTGRGSQIGPGKVSELFPRPWKLGVLGLRFGL